MWGLPLTVSEYFLRFYGMQRYKNPPKGKPPYAVHLIWGASAVLIYCVIDSPLSKPRNIIGGHVLSALTGTILSHIFKHTPPSLRWLPAALSVAIATVVMDITGTLHPPGGATAYLGVNGGAAINKVGWWYPLFPVLSGILVMFAIAMVTNNVFRRFPIAWWRLKLPPVVVLSPQPGSQRPADANLDGRSLEGSVAPSIIATELNKSDPNANRSSSSSRNNDGSSAIALTTLSAEQYLELCDTGFDEKRDSDVRLPSVAANWERERHALLNRIRELESELDRVKPSRQPS
ncbi:hypothetical protein EV182_003196 [Spiromyces aspiralis]|uniref:Uncharacterized protein n=1 Tax=Spiromyces aspiralis TaxID=68401 RepID=A0ACC1HU60_9FUNG|nr:hypothetical protein EV182_003196 [Spiromyces aspiralis]